MSAWRSLRARLVVAFLLVSLPPMLFAAELASKAVASAFERNVEAWLRESAAYFVGTIHESEREATGVAEFLAGEHDAIGRLIDRDDSLPRRLQDLLGAIGYDLLLIYDSQNRLIYSSRPVGSIENVRVSAEQRLSRVTVGEQSFLMIAGQQAFEHRGETYHLVLGNWIDDEYLGALDAVTDLELRLYVRQDDRFRELYASHGQASASATLDPAIAAAVEARGEPYYDSRAEGGRYFGVYSPLRGKEGEIVGIVFGGLKSYAALRSWFSRSNLFLIIMLTGTALAIVAALIVSRRLTRPLGALVHGVQAIAAGNYGQKVAVTGRDEVAELAQAFNDMAARLARSKELEAQIRLQQRLSALGEVAVGIAHEVRNPLGIIKTSAELIQKRSHLPETDARLLGYVVDEVRRIDSLIRDFLDFAKPRAPMLRSVRPAAVIERAAAFCAPELERAGLSFAFHDRVSGGMILADEDQLFQALLNLMVNAIDATPRGGHIEICTEAAGDELRIRVTDTGIGISTEVQERMFNPFFTTKERGSGLGLAKVFSMMESHHGRIECRSRPSEGATFTLVFAASMEAQVDVAHRASSR